MVIYIVAEILFLVVLAYFTFKPKKIKEIPFTFHLAAFLEERVLFYKKLDATARLKFEEEVHYFLNHVKITGVKCIITDEDKALVAAAATVPIFHFNNWFYHNLKEVIIYPSGFNYNFELGDEHTIQGMVGNQFMNGQMLLSKRALHGGFDNKTDKNNTAIHEFVHLIDMADGDVDGIPEVFMREQNVLPWVDLMYQNITKMKEGESDINIYGATNEAEFLSVTAEYFFERPYLFKTKHPELYQILEDTFNAKK